MAGFHAAASNLYREALPWLEDFKQSGRAIWDSTALPTRKTEAWKYTSVRALERGDFASPAANDDRPVDELVDRYRIAGLNPATLVFINGHYSSALSESNLPDGIDLVRFADATEAEAAEIKRHLGTVVDAKSHLFAALNASWTNDGVFIRVRGSVEQPLQLVWLTLPQAESFAVSQRLLVVMDKGSSATLVEHFVSSDEAQNSFTNGTTEIVVGDGASLRHYRLHLEEEHALHIGGVHVDLHRDSRLESFHLALGGPLKRVDIEINHRGEGAECVLDGVYLPRHHQLVDYHTNIQHRVPRCTTSETFRGIVADNAKAVFNGRIHIHPDAQKTRAELSNKNLLTSDKAEVDTKPELEIYADDVQCAHGATVARLEEQALFYLVSRGIARQDAQVMLSFGFINELVERLQDEAISDYLRPVLTELFGRGSLAGSETL